ncbi:PcfJ domain-containing protein [Photobacterium leiognathi]|uniref:PcfJ domain-containing protein n=1 Tax=Photobacterium leiognathi TaxID=553611 RepID=UPI002980B246|nr:PcfJ domain-containing protein [Photobacterium leiognathi]
MIKKLNNPDLYFEVINLLKNKFPRVNFDQIDIFDNPIITGQSVCNAILEILNIIDSSKLKYNDLDVFVAQEPKVIKNSKNDITCIKSGLRYTHGYCGSYQNANKSYHDIKPLHKYFILSSLKSTEQLNVTYVAISDTSTVKIGDCNKTTEARTIINGFDFNLLQVALVDKKIIYTQSFVDFLYQLTIKVVNLNTPLHSICRLSKKMDEMPFLINHDINNGLLETAHVIANQIQPKLIDVNINKKILTSEIWTSQLNFQLKKIGHSTFHDHIIIKSEDKHRTNIDTHSYDKKIIRINRTKNVNLQLITWFEKIITQHTIQLDDIFNLIIHVYEIFTSKNKINNQKRKNIEFVTNMIGTDKTYNIGFFLNQIVNSKTAIKISKDDINRMKGMSHHTAIIKKLNQLPLEKQFIAYKALNWLTKNNLTHLIGVLETHQVFSKNCIKILTSNNNKLLLALDKHLYSIENNGEKSIYTIRESLLLTDSGTITQLTTAKSLKEQGRQQRHCVGGYTSLVMNGTSLIFNLKPNNGESSTLELRRSNDTKKNYTSIQHKTRFNRQPAADNILMEKELLNRLNSQDIDDIFNNQTANTNFEITLRKEAYIEKALREAIIPNRPFKQWVFDDFQFTLIDNLHEYLVEHRNSFPYFYSLKDVEHKLKKVAKSNEFLIKTNMGHTILLIKPYEYSAPRIHYLKSQGIDIPTQALFMLIETCFPNECPREEINTTYLPQDHHTAVDIF